MRLIAKITHVIRHGVLAKKMFFHFFSCVLVYFFYCSSGIKLPSSDIFGNSLYTFYIGQNDFTFNLAVIGVGAVQEYLPQVVSQIVATIKVRLP